MMSLSFLFLSGCYLNANLAKTIDESSPSETIPSPTIDPDPDMIVIGQDSWVTAKADNANLSKIDSLHSPRFVYKIGNRYFVSDFGNHRILVFINTLSGLPSYVLGQSDFNSSGANYFGNKWEVSGKSLYNPNQIVSDGTRLIVSDTGNNRVLIWNSIPTFSGQPADVVIGQTNFTDRFSNQGSQLPTAATLNWPSGLILLGGKLIISDENNNRILIYNSIPTQNGASADMVMGQPDFISMAINRTGNVSPAAANSFYFPSHLATDGTKLFVVDYGNNRVLVWNSLPNVINVNASLVIGQTSFTLTAASTTQTGLKSPRGLALNDGALYIADSGNSRIVYHSAIPSGNGAAATSILGQSTYTASSKNRGLLTPSGNTLSEPGSISILDFSLWITDTGNHRLVEFNSIPRPGDLTAGSIATGDSIWGQTSFSTNYPNQIQVPNQFGIGRVSGVCRNGTWLVVSDSTNNRYLVFSESDPKAGPIAVIGQMDFNSGFSNQNSATPSASSLYLNNVEQVCAIDSKGRLYIPDEANSRILVWNHIPTSNGVSADYVIGQPSFTTKSPIGCNANGLNWPTGILIDNDRLFVADYLYNRTLIFNVSGNLANITPSTVIGQPDLATCTGGTSEIKAKGPRAVTSDGTRLFVKEYLNNRIVVYNTIPTNNGVSADYVIGQPDFQNTLSGIAANRFYKNGNNGVRGIMSVINGFLVTPDYYQKRILAFDLSKLANDMNASYVFNQPDFVTDDIMKWRFSNDSNTAFSSMIAPIGVNVFQGDPYVWISDAYRLIRVKRDKFFNYGSLSTQ
ncbi:MAG: hypothetical protein JNM39_00585 [Bdellovibrionaceae bacterium]|nr:hypothetical protein [Pseudobdellovibrionaceae bacterium]